MSPQEHEEKDHLCPGLGDQPGPHRETRSLKENRMLRPEDQVLSARLSYIKVLYLKRARARMWLHSGSIRPWC